MAHERLGGLGGFAQIHIVGRHLAPTETLLALLGDDALDHFFKLLALFALVDGKNHAYAIVTGVGQLKPEAGAGVLQKSMGNLHQDPGSVAGVLLATAGAAMVEVLQYRQRLIDDLMGLLALDVDDEPDAASIMLEARIVKPLFLWPSRLIHRTTLHFYLHRETAISFNPVAPGHFFFALTFSAKPPANSSA